MRYIALAWKQVLANKGAAGVDDVSIEEFPDTFRSRWHDIRSTVLEGKYKLSPVLMVEIPKPDGSFRPLGIPTLLDRLILQSLAQILGRMFDSGFSKSSCTGSGGQA